MSNNRPPRRAKTSRDSTWNILTAVMLLLTFCTCGYFYSIYSNPFSLLNFFPPDTPTITPIPPTITPIALPATWTPTFTPIPSASNTKRPTITLEPTNTPFSMATATSLYTATITPKPTGAPYGATISYHASTTFRSDTDCSKLFVAGHVKKASKETFDGAILQLGGNLPGKAFVPLLTTLSGMMQNIYGASGFEFDTGVKPAASTQTLWIQLFSQSKQPLSAQVFLTTYTSCEKNLIMVNFQEK